MARVPYDSLILGDNARVVSYGDLSDLVESIRQHGLINPIRVRPIEASSDIRDSGARYRIVSGFRRHRAIGMLRDAGENWESVPVTFFEGDAVEELLENLAENAGRKDVNALELGRRFAFLRDRHDLSSREIGRRSGYGRTHVCDCIAIAERLAPEIVQALETPHFWADSGRVPMRDLVALTRLTDANGNPDHDAQRKEWQKSCQTPETTEPHERPWDAPPPKRPKKMRPRRKVQLLLRTMREANDPQWTGAIQALRWILYERKTPPIELPKP